MTQGIQSLMMIFGIAIVLFVVNAKLAAIALVAMPLVAILTYNFGRRVMPISREVQQLKADVTEAADESVVGIEMVQAFGREDDVQARFNVKASRVRDGVLRQARVEGLFLPGLLFLPSLSIAADRVLRRHRRDQRAPHERAVLSLLPTAPAARVAARSARLDPVARPAGDRLRVAHVRVAAGDRDDPRGGRARDGPRRPTRRHVRERALLVPDRQRGPVRRGARDRARRSRRGLRADGRRQDVAAQPAATFLRPGRGPRAARRRGRQHHADRGSAHRRRDRDPAAHPLLDPPARQPHRCASRMRRGKRSSPPARRPASRTSRPTSPTATTR